MKYIQVRRHAPKHAEGHLTDEGKQMVDKVRNKLPQFTLIISSNKPRAIETAKLLTGKEPIIDKRAGTPAFSLDIEQTLHVEGQNHPFGIAGVIFDNPEYRVMIKKQGEKLAELIAETLLKLPENGTALIISHDGVMVATEKVLRKAMFDKASKTFKPLEGFQIDEKGEITDLD
ncbi:hypothetical protein COY87_05350 [Candidatus Roizmanbacteria bacterium CG_4_10_14_0_8_um_filter_33_9]|uniref:Histidine phosphatase family protein n=1 Tax=Candidatus Roizmanbacteria bacterium CG_4_10_14_0_8_um_filter_33_9 TaxID=1974826 RepID=A0A2M7QGY0_9BACT|nr:MAG: hypothetical protein COY87_05350 [Candidatus Roizmanbacteria bacterium CG_4_10_14_0_8_um_filter_33_9]